MENFLPVKSRWKKFCSRNRSVFFRLNLKLKQRIFENSKDEPPPAAAGGKQQQKRMEKSFQFNPAGNGRKIDLELSHLFNKAMIQL